MAHPQMFDDADPVLGRLKEICLALPGADMKISHGRPAFCTKKIFAPKERVAELDAGDLVQTEDLDR